MEKRAK